MGADGAGLTGDVVGVALVLVGAGGPGVVVGDGVEAGGPDAQLVGATGVVEFGAVDDGDVGRVERVRAAAVRRVAAVALQGRR